MGSNGFLLLFRVAFAQIKFFRANVLFRNFDVKGGSDRTLIYLTLCVSQFLSECERSATKAEAEKILQSLSSKSFSVPGESGWVLGGMYPPPKSAAEGENFKAYFKQCREEVVLPQYSLLPRAVILTRHNLHFETASLRTATQSWEGKRVYSLF